MGEYWRLRPTQEQLGRLQKAIKEYGTQGEIVLPKEDKYEKFKEYVDGIAPHTCISQIKILFKEFEDEYETKKREEEIKQILAHSIYGKDYYYATIGEQEEIRNIYTRLDEGGYLK